MVHSPTLPQFQGLFAAARSRMQNLPVSLAGYKHATPHTLGLRLTSTFSVVCAFTTPCQYISKSGLCLVGITSLTNLQVFIVKQHPFSPCKGAYHSARLIQ